MKGPGTARPLYSVTLPDPTKPVRQTLTRHDSQGCRYATTLTNCPQTGKENGSEQASDALYATPPILLVEDQPANQIVLRQQLAKLGYTIDFAKHGREALERLAQPCHGYQLVLMDCQMPVMDGFEATRWIRRREQTTGGHIPIIAMTAQAMKGIGNVVSRRAWMIISASRSI